MWKTPHYCWQLGLVLWSEGKEVGSQVNIGLNILHACILQLWPKVLRMTHIIFHKVCCLSLYDGNLHILQNVMKRKSPKLNSQKTFPLHFSPATKGPADIMSLIISLTQVWVLTRTRLEITLSCWLSSNNRLEASKGGWCLESLFFLGEPRLPARKHMPLSLLCTKRASQARILLPVRLHLNQPFIGSSITSRRVGPLLWRRIQGAQESPASARTIS